MNEKISYDLDSIEKIFLAHADSYDKSDNKLGLEFNLPRAILCIITEIQKLKKTENE